jgi:rSAM/selenodomain-associated transferase 2
MITIIVPAHNEKKNLEKLAPVLKGFQDKASCEIVIALSLYNSDGSDEFLKKFGLPFIKCKGKGRAVQMNEAASISKGDIFAFLHADVLPPKSFIADIQSTISNDFDAGYFSYRFDSKNFFLKINSSFTTRDGIFTGGGDQCLFIKKNIFEKLNGFNEDQIVMEDFEFFDRLKKQKIPYRIIKNDLIVSARKYKYNSYLRVNFSNMLLMILYKLGYSSKKLKTLHHRLLKTSY